MMVRILGQSISQTSSCGGVPGLQWSVSIRSDARGQKGHRSLFCVELHSCRAVRLPMLTRPPPKAPAMIRTGPQSNEMSPPIQSNELQISVKTETVARIQAKHPEAFFLISGDFSRVKNTRVLEDGEIRRSHSLQAVQVSYKQQMSCQT